MSYNGLEGIKFLRWVIRQWFRWSTCGTTPNSLVKITKVDHGGNDLECKILWNKPDHAAPVAVNNIFKIKAASVNISNKTVDKYFVLIGLQDDGANVGFKIVEKAGQP